MSPVLEGVVGKTHVTAVDLIAPCCSQRSLLHSLMALLARFLAFVKVCGSTYFLGSKEAA